ALHPRNNSPLVPYTTLFRSKQSLSAEIASLERVLSIREQQLKEGRALPLDAKRARASIAAARYRLREMETSAARAQAQLGFLLRSEEHTSELQSRENLVCRL